MPVIAVGAKHGLIIAADASLWTWGASANGWPVLGLGSVDAQPSLRQIGSDTNWVSIAPGWHHNLALKSDGTLWGWGQNIYGQLGLGTNRPEMAHTPVRSAAGNDWKQAAAGGSHSLALKKDGTLWAYGNNWAGQLGIGATNRMVLEPAQVGAATNWVKVRAGLLESVGLQSDGTLWCWGRQAHHFTSARAATPTRVGTNSDWQAICPNGWLYQILLKKDGSLWAMHSSLTKSRAGSALPELTRLDLKQGVIAFAGGGTKPFGAVLTADGEVWTWGKVLGKDIPERPALQYMAKLLRQVKVNVHWGESKPTMRDEIWQLPISTSDPQRLE